MEDKEYLTILFNGLSKHYEYLPKYFKREQLKAEKEHIDKDEFVGRLIKAIRFLEGEIDLKLIEDKIGFSKCKNGENNIEIDETIKNLSIEKYPLSVSHYTNSEFTGYLWMKDINFLKESMNEVFLYETVGEPVTINLEEYLEEKKQIEEKQNSFYSEDLNKNWFKVGVKFATGEMYELKEKFDGNFSAIAKHLYHDQHKGYRPYITESFSRTNINHHNIFSNSLKMEKIKKFCEDMDLPICKKFMQ